MCFAWLRSKKIHGLYALVVLLLLVLLAISCLRIRVSNELNGAFKLRATQRRGEQQAYDSEDEENKLAVSKLGRNKIENDADLLREIDSATVLIRKRLAIQHRKHNLRFQNPSMQQSICIVSMHEYSDGPMKLLNEKLIKNKRDFVGLHPGYSYVEIASLKYREQFAKTTLPATWLKLIALRDLMVVPVAKKAPQSPVKPDWFLWVDADVVFTNSSSCMFQELLSTNHHAIFAADFNSGVFLVRNHAWSVAFLDNWFAQWETLRFSFGQEDQALGQLLANDTWNPYIYWAPEKWFSLIGSYPLRLTPQGFTAGSSWQPGHCILHAAGFWQHKASILHDCLITESSCAQRLKRLTVEHNNTTAF